MVCIRVCAVLKILLSLKLIAGCDRDLLGFPKISLWLQYGPSGCSTDHLVVVGTSRGGGCQFCATGGLFGLDSWGLCWGDLGGIWGALGGSLGDLGGVLEGCSSFNGQ